MAKYIVKHTTILHNKKAYAEGTTIDLKEDDAKRLADFLEAIPETTPNKQNGNKKAEQKSQDNTKTDKSEGDGVTGGADGEKTV